MSAVVPASLRVSIDVPPEVRVGQTVPMTLRLQNVGDQPIELYLRGRTIAFDVVVTRSDGDVVWRRLEGEIVPAIIQQVPLGAGKVLELETEWDQCTTSGTPVEPGRYDVLGILPTDERDPITTDRTQIRIVTS